VSFAIITLFVASQRVIPKVRVYVVIDSVRNFWIHPHVLTAANNHKSVAMDSTLNPSRIIKLWCLSLLASRDKTIKESDVTAVPKHHTTKAYSRRVDKAPRPDLDTSID
jgi:hypothetical protein